MQPTNPMPWIALGVIVLVVLAYKGVLPNPFATRAARKSNVENGAGSRHDTPCVSYGSGVAVSPDDLLKHGSYTLGIAFAKAKRLEAEAGLERDFAMQYGSQIEANYRAPFVPPAQAPAAPPSQGPPPPAP